MATRSRPQQAFLVGLGGRLTLAAVSLFFGLAILEVGLRLALPDATPIAVPEAERYRFFSHHPRLGWDHVPGVVERVAGDEFDVTVRLNAAGMRAEREYAPVPPPGTRRIVAVGDSFTFGYGVENDEVYVTRLERLLENGTEVLNLAVTGYGTDQQLLKLLDQGLAYRPDLVLLGLFEGDVFRNHRLSQLGYPKPRFVLDGDGDGDGALRLTGVPVPATLPPASKSALARSAIARVLAGPGRTLLEHLGAGEAWPVTEAILARARDECRAAGAELAVVVIPKDQAIYGRGPRRRLHLHTLARIDAMLERLGIDHLDLTPGLAAAAAARPDVRLYFHHDGHWNAAGHAAAAELLASWLTGRER